MNFPINGSPVDYDVAAVIADETGREMLSRLDFMQLAPRTVLDLGCGTGQFSRALKNRFPAAQIFAIDASAAMLSALPAEERITPLCASLDAMPTFTQPVDLIFANLLLPWVDEALFISTCKRLLRPEGLLIFSGLGIDTLKEYQAIFSPEQLPRLADMHNVGDALLAAGWLDSVVDVNTYTLTYQDKTKLFAELKATGMIDVPESVIAELIQHSNLPSADGVWPVTYEVMIAHAFAPFTRQSAAVSIAEVPLSELRGRRG